MGRVTVALALATIVSSRGTMALIPPRNGGVVPSSLSLGLEVEPPPVDVKASVVGELADVVVGVKKVLDEGGRESLVSTAVVGCLASGYLVAKLAASAP